MEEYSQSTSSPSSAKIGFVIVAIIALAAVGVLAYENRSTGQSNSEQMVVEETTSPAGAQTGESVTSGMNDEATAAEQSQYESGEYTVTGEYTSPGGPETIEVTVILEDGVVVDAEVVPQATLPISQQMQNAFVGGYEEFVIGKNIDEIELTKVAGSSLTPKGFNDAVEKIKQEALS